MSQENVESAVDARALRSGSRSWLEDRQSGPAKKSPIAGVKPILAKRHPQLARSQLIFPTAQYTKNCTLEPVLGGQQGQEVTKAFNGVIYD